MEIQERIEKFDKALGKYVSNSFRTWLIDEGFFTAPASTKYHGSKPGGLFEHSLLMMNVLLKLSIDNKVKWKREASPFIVGMFHDLCKIDQYKRDAEGGYTFDEETLFCGHGDKSIILLASHMILTPEELACIRYHMGAYTDKKEWGYYSRAVEKYPTVLWTHTADMIASQVIGG